MFDIKKFAASIQYAQQGASSAENMEQWLKEEFELERAEGVSFVLETYDREGEDRFRSRLKQSLNSAFEYDLERLFEGSENEDPLDEKDDLARFWLLKLPGIRESEIDENLFDFAYHVRDNLSLRSVEPDLAFVAGDAYGEMWPGSLGKAINVDRAWSLRNMRVPQAWKVFGAFGSGIKVGHPDTGYADHVDLDAKRLEIGLGWDFVDRKADPKDPLNYRGFKGHGTSTGSVIVSGGTVTPVPKLGDGGTGGPGKITGVAPAAKLVPVRTSKKVYWVFSSKLAQAIYHCRKKQCDVISISMGGRGLRGLRLALADAVRKNVIVVAAAGNGLPPSVVWPAAYRDCIALAASNGNDAPWRKSSRGKAVDVSAPGEGVWRALRNQPGQPQTIVAPSSGTSYAVANTAGAAALWLEHHGWRASASSVSSPITLQELFRDALKNSARTPQGWNTKKYGTGIVDVLALLKQKLANKSAPLATNQEQDDYLRQSVDYLAPLPEETAIKVLRGALFSETAPLREVSEKWGNEILSIFLQLELEGNPLFDDIRQSDSMAIDQRCKALKCLLRARSSAALISTMETS